MFGQNPIAKKRHEADGFLVHSVFYTIQGEGPWAGLPTIFLRLAGCNLQCNFCFVGSTRIRMGDGSVKRIAEVQIGDMVLAYDTESGKFAPKRVINTMQSKTKELVTVRTGASTNETDLLTATYDHPILVRDKGWVKAGELQPGDIIVHLSKHERARLFNCMKNPATVAKVAATALARGTHANGGQLGKLWNSSDSTLRASVTERMVSRNPMKDPAIAAKGFLARKDRGHMTHIETALAASWAHLPIRFVGDGSLQIGFKFPDFVVEGQKKVIEVWDVTHAPLAYRDSEWQRKRAETFAKEGYQTLFLPVENNKAVMAAALQAAAEFVHNGHVVSRVDVIPMGSKAWTRYAGSAKSEAHVYNLEVEDWHTYVANGKIVHNCDTEFTEGAQPFSLQSLGLRLINMAKIHNCNKIVITGGEPMLQPLSNLIKNLPSLTFQIETAGTVWPAQFEEAVNTDRVLIVCSPKTPKVHWRIKVHCSHYKYIIDSRGEFTANGIPANVFEPDERACKESVIYMQPCDVPDDAQFKANIAHAVNLSLQHGHRLSIQVHKIAGVP